MDSNGNHNGNCNILSMHNENLRLKLELSARKIKDLQDEVARLKKTVTQYTALPKPAQDDGEPEDESLQETLDRMDGYGIDNECGARG
jgi:hypothetical protein